LHRKTVKPSNSVFVLNKDKQPLSPCHPARARELLDKKKASVFRLYPFTIILKTQKKNPKFQDTRVKIDPGSRTTGIALIIEGEKKGWFLIWAANLEHRGHAIVKKLISRRQQRRSRRNRKTRYRQPRFSNRKHSKPKGWLPPSLLSRVNNVTTIVKRIQKFCYVESCTVETVKFDTQKMQNSEIKGIEYQQGELQGYEVKEYLLEKYKRTCIYCGKTDVPLEVEHIVPKSKNGSNRVSNLAIACHFCNQKKGNKNLEEFLKKKPDILKSVKSELKKSLSDVAAVNSTRKKIKEELKKLIIETSFSKGYITKYNRLKQKYKKDHWIDAACVGKYSGIEVFIPKRFKPIIIKANGRGHRRFCSMDKYGFPKSKPRQRRKQIEGVQSNDTVRATHKKGTFVGRVGLSNDQFTMKVETGYIRFNASDCKILHKEDGYVYSV